MRYHALCTDYDGTLAHHGAVDGPTLAALERLRESGRRTVLVTGRELDELLEVFAEVDRFDLVVAENGALLYDPKTREETPLAERPPERFIVTLRERGVEPMSVGRVIVATWEPHETVVLQTIRDLGLELQVIFNKGAVMVLPSGVNKATGLVTGLKRLGLSPHNAVAVGDAENDHAFLAVCEAAVAVANALPTVKERCDLVTAGGQGTGVTELIGRLLEDDLAELEPKLERHGILLGPDARGREVKVRPYGVNVLIAGTSGSGKSTLTMGLLERLAAAGYQFCIVDPEGDFAELGEAVTLGDPDHEPTADEVLDVLCAPDRNATVSLLGFALEHRPAFFQALLPRLQSTRAETGRPHWIVVDETHHLLPAGWEPAGLTLPRELRGMLFITVHPESVAPAVLESIDLLVVVGDQPAETVSGFCGALGVAAPQVDPVGLEPGEVLAWDRRSGAPPARITSVPPRGERRRHSRKYAEGDLGPDRSFYFRGPRGKLRLRAQNLMLFLQMAEGVDEATWSYHLGRGDYSRWFRDGIKDESLAAEAARVERERGLSPSESLGRIRRLIEARYSLPEGGPSGVVDGPR